jgi:hypothetical protein
MIVLYSATLLLGAGLLFTIEPMMGKLLLPVLGGAPEVWIATQLFFQLVLLAGYAYGHLLGDRVRPRRQALVHAALLGLGLVLLPVGVHPGGSGAVHHPVAWLLGLLTVTIALPFLLVSALGPLLGRWISTSAHRSATDPYFLYAASNAGSLLGLLAYPIVIEPTLDLGAQAQAWAWGYRGLLVLTAACAVWLWRPSSGSRWPARRAARATGPKTLTWPRRARWLALAAVPSSLMLGVTSFITRDLAPVPLLWVIPLAVYLASLIVAFAPGLPSERVVAITRIALPGVVIALVYTMAIGSQRPLWLLLALHLIGLAVAALMAHAALAGDRPSVGHLTEFYLWLALGGALGGVFNAVIAPLVFPSLIEYPVAIVSACLLRPRAARARPGLMEMIGAPTWVTSLSDVTLPAVFGLVLAAVLRATAGDSNSLATRSIVIGFAAGLIINFARRPARFGLAVAVIFLAASAGRAGGTRVLDRQRTFFGVYQVVGAGAYHELFDGTTLHGIERMGAGRPVLLSYYDPAGPVGQVFGELRDRSLASRTAVVGLGTGAMACYSRPSDHFTFYEIDPEVARIAQNPRLFGYLRGCAGNFRVVLGDARRSLQSETGARYGVIAFDAFSSDAIPVHLLTRQALTLYLARLDPRGLLLFHISNRYLDLRPELGGLAAGAGLVCRVEHFLVPPAQARQHYDQSTWVVIARRPSDLGGLAADRRWRVCPGHRSQAWTDEHSSLLGLLKWG